MEQITKPVEKIACVLQFPREVWDSEPHIREYADHYAKASMEQLGTVVGEVTCDVYNEAEIYGMRLFPEDGDGNPIAPRVIVRYTSYAIRR